MKKFKISLTVAISLLIPFAACNKQQGNEKGQQQHKITEATAKNQSKDDIPTAVKLDNNVISATNGKGIVVDFYADWCPPCRNMAPIFHEFATKYGNSLNFVSINVDKYGELSEKYNVSSIPCFIFLTADGREISRTVGAIPAEAFAEILNSTFPEAIP